MDNKKAHTTRAVLIAFASRNYINFVTIILLIASTCFFVGAQRMRRMATASNPDLFVSGDIVQILEVIDGDELIIGDQEGGRTLFRLLGIKSFSPTVSDPQLSEYGRICFQYLRGRTENSNARLEISDKRLDNKGRLLGKLYLKDAQRQYTVDLARELVQKGYTLVYTRFDFKDMDTYLEVQNRAKREKAGFWSDEKIADRATSMVLMWDEEKRND